MFPVVICPNKREWGEIKGELSASDFIESEYFPGQETQTGPKTSNIKPLLWLFLVMVKIL